MASSTKFTSDPIPSLDRIVLYFRFIGKGLEYVQKEVELRTGIKKCYGPQQEIIMKKWVAFFKKQDATKLEWKNINALELGEVLGRGVKKRSFDAHLKLRKELKMRSKK